MLPLLAYPLIQDQGCHVFFKKWKSLLLNCEGIWNRLRIIISSGIWQLEEPHYMDKLTSTDLTATWGNKRQGIRVHIDWKRTMCWGVPCFILHSFRKKYWTTQHANTKLLFFGRVKHHQRKKNRKEKKRNREKLMKQNITCESNTFFRQGKI